MQKKIGSLLTRRAFGSYAIAASKPTFLRADLGEFPEELDRSFMTVLDSGVDVQSEDYLSNYKQMLAKNEELDRFTGQALHVEADYRKKSLSRGKLLPRERISAVLDPGSPFLELSQLAGLDYQNEKKNVPSGNLVAGVGMIAGRQCMIIANNHSFSAGAYYPITVKKHVRAQEIAEENNLPCVYMVDSAGAHLPSQDEVFPDRNHFGRIFFN